LEIVNYVKPNIRHKHDTPDFNENTNKLW
jgi:hypothetical protein